MIVLISVVSLFAVTNGHAFFAHPSIYDCTRKTDRRGAANPLEGVAFSKWWYHGSINCPPESQYVFDLPANGKADMAITNYWDRVDGVWARGTAWNGRFSFAPMSPREVVSNITLISGMSGARHNFHIRSRGNAGGCALAIAYKGRASEVKQNDFVVFSIVRDCPTRQLQEFSIPNLPSCNGTSTGLCQCAWFWTHQSNGGSDQNYMTAFNCRVTEARSTAQPIDYANAQPPRMCYNPRNCFFGPRIPMYWHNERDNMPEPWSGTWAFPGAKSNAPLYATTFGWREGAQNDIFVNTNPYRNRTRQPRPSPSRSMLVSNTAGDTLKRGNELVSPNGKYKVKLTSGCKAEVVGSEGQVYHTEGSSSSGNCRLKINEDGRLETRTDSRRVWSSPLTRPADSQVTWPNAGVPPYSLEITNEGQMLIRDGYRQNRWESMFKDKRHWMKYDARVADPREWG